MLERQVSVFPDQLRLLRFEPDADWARYVFLTIQRDLFGGAMLVAEAGRAGSSGRLVRRVFADEGLAVTALLDMSRVLAGRGYVDARFAGRRSREADRAGLPGPTCLRSRLNADKRAGNPVTGPVTGRTEGDRCPKPA